MTSQNETLTSPDSRPPAVRSDASDPESQSRMGSSSGKNGAEPGRSKSDNIKNESPSTTSPASATALVKQFTAPASGTTSPRDSPRSSRNTSPTRPMSRPELPNTSKGIKSRNNSHEMSPSRPPTSATTHQTVPSAAAIQRALSSAAAPSLHQIAVPDPQSKLPKPQKTTGSVATGSEAAPPHWPVSPRLKSPSPSAGSRRNSLLNPSTQLQRKTDSASAPVTPSIVIQRSTPGSNTPASSTASEPPSAQSDESFPTPPKTSKSTALETVQENNSPVKGGVQPVAAERNASGRITTRSSEEDRPPTISEDSTEEPGDKLSKTTESESESGGNKSDGRGRRHGQNGQSGQRPKTHSAQRQYGPLAPAKARSGQENPGNMTVETETVSSVPQATLSGGSERSGNSRGEGGPGSLRLKPSTETIRPKKDRKKASRKQTSIQSGTGGSHYHCFSSSDQQQDADNKASGTPNRPGFHSANSSRLLQHHCSSSTNRGMPQTPLLSPADAETPRILSPTLRRFTDFNLRKASSKADIFEAKVASAVDEANSSDSDDTYVYDNQPETHTRPRDHSRTPSVASIASQVDRRGGSRSIGDALASGHRVTGKRSMKFSSAYNDADSPDHRNDTVRSSHSRTAGGSGTHLHHHIGRHGRSAGTHTPVLDTDVPFSATKHIRSRPSSRPASASQDHFPHRTKKNGEVPFDIDVEGADDERTPLMGTVRTPRNRTHRPRPGSASLRQMDYYQNRRRSWIARFFGWIIVAVMLALVIIGAVGFLFATTKPLYDVSIKEIQNVLASEQELMLDLLVEAINPNIITVSITDMDVNIFAKSKHIASDPSSPSSTPYSTHRRRAADHSSPSPSPLPTSQSSPSTTSVLSSGWPPWWDPDDDHGIDKGTDPIPDPSGDSSTMLLGRIFHFDSALSFDGSPIKHHAHYSVGELRLEKPGNKTEAGGSARWEKVLDWPFELIVRGVLKYQIPLSGRTKTVAIGRSVVVHPEEGVDENGGMRTEVGWGLGPGPRVDEEGGSGNVDEGEDEMGWDPI
ncbi:hypothetical protein EV356DRAFT_511482 [Viridothelium virens]|uniref:Phospholipid metabolism enzyme regulator n=1 Tax=Viridothelium virens TaxID=1048519 RepID=A0A6A6HH20_VIRVR|nr:hypothetical protein EV356DRAFT_511482 [Viridothelium virens]